MWEGPGAGVRGVGEVTTGPGQGPWMRLLLQVTMVDRVAAERACKDPNPNIDGRKANVNLAYLGAKPRSLHSGRRPFPFPGSAWLLYSAVVSVSWNTPTPTRPRSVSRLSCACRAVTGQPFPRLGAGPLHLAACASGTWQ